MKTTRVLKILSRTDKWYLGGGNRLLWAPPFPQFLDSPGFWDKAHYYNCELQPLFTWTLLDEDGREIPLTAGNRKWDPSCLRQEFSGRVGGTRLTAIEEKVLLPGDVAVSHLRIRLKGKGRRTIQCVAWSVQENFPEKQTTWLERPGVENGAVTFMKKVTSGGPHIDCGVAFGLNRPVKSYCLQLSEGSAILPHWRLTPFVEKFARAKLPSTVQLSGTVQDGLLFMALHAELKVQAGTDEAIVIGFAAAPTTAEAAQNLGQTLGIKDPVVSSRRSWSNYFESVPAFECSDPFLMAYYWYRWYGLRLNTIWTTEGNYNNPFVCEGIGYFRAPISYSAVCHMLENRWMSSPRLAQGSLLTFVENQREDGGFRGYIDVHHFRQEMFYHANWGDALLQLQRLHPSAEFLSEAYDGLSRYARYFDRERDEEVSGLYDIDNHYETGQEYMHRYIAVNPEADREHWGSVFRLKGVDVTTYLYELKRALASVARILNKNEEADLWDIEADRTKAAILTTMWDPDEEMFFDVDPSRMTRTGVKAAVCFYPYFTDIVDESHLAGLKRHLLNPREFWTPHPVPSSSADDEFFSAEPEWKGKRMNCPWNGRVWPMTNSHVAEALARSGIRFRDRSLRRIAAEFITRYVRMMFFDGDPTRPNCFEHYNPVTGSPCVYRGIDDYQHSWVVDLLITYLCGVQPQDSGVTIDPLPFGCRHVLIDRVQVRGRMLKVEITGNRFSVCVDGRLQARSTLGKPIVLPTL